MFIRLKKAFKHTDIYLFLSFIIGLLPASFIIHIIPVDFSGYYYQAVSFLNYKGYAYQIITNYCNNPINSGLNARAPFVPLVMALSMNIFGNNLLGIYFPFFIVRILLLPLTYLVAKKYLPKKWAFLSTLLIVLIPKLQTYSLGAFEADIFVAFFYLLAMYFYQKSNIAQNKYKLLTGVSLGLGALSKSTGFSIALGFCLSIFLQNLNKLKEYKTKMNLYHVLLGFVMFIGPYLFWTFVAHHQIYITTQNDRSFMYIFSNLPSLLYTIPLYLGINFSLGLKATLISCILLIFLFIGLYRVLQQKVYTLVLPTFITLFMISTLASCVIGWNIPANYEFITILGFTMIPTAIIFMIGVYYFTKNVTKKIFGKSKFTILVSIFILLVMFKFLNNYFSAKYALNFLPDEYYISLPTIIKNKSELPQVNFTIEKGLRIFKGPVIHRLVRTMYTNYRFDPFSPIYKNLVIFFTGIGLLIVIFDQRN